MSVHFVTMTCWLVGTGSCLSFQPLAAASCEKVSLAVTSSTGYIEEGEERKASTTELRISVRVEVAFCRGGLPGISVLTSLMVSVDVKQYWNHAHALVSGCP